MPLDTGDNRPLGFSYFCNFDDMPGVVACSMKINPSLEESCYRSDLQDILDRIDSHAPRRVPNKPERSFYCEKDQEDSSTLKKRNFDLEEIENALDGVLNNEQREEIKRRLRIKD